MNAFFPNPLKRLPFGVTVMGVLFAGLISGQAQGLGILLTADSYTALQGESFTGTLNMSYVYDYYDSYNYDNSQYTMYDYYTGYAYDTDWYVHEYYDAPTYVSITGPGITTMSQEVDWPASVAGNKQFTFNYPTNSSAGPDLVGTVSYLGYDPEPDDDNPYWYYCYWYYWYSDYFSTNTAMLTLLNPNTFMNIAVVGSSQLTESEAAQSTTIEIYRADNYNARTVYYTLSGDATAGLDYAALSGYVTIPAGAYYADFDVSTLADANQWDLDEPTTLTLTLTQDSLHSYQLGADTSVTITFQNDDTETGDAQLARSVNPSFNDQNIGYAKNGTNGPGRWATNGVLNASTAILNVFATAPYATGTGLAPGEFTVTRRGVLTNAFTLNYLVTGTAIAGSNYTALPATVSFAANQISTNLLVNVLTNTPLTNAQTVVCTLSNSGSYFLGYSTQAVVTLLPLGSATNSVASPAGRYWRGSGGDPTYWSQVIPLDAETGTNYSNTNGNCSSLYPGLTSWSGPTLYHYNAAGTRCPKPTPPTALRSTIPLWPLANAPAERRYISASPTVSASTRATRF